MKNRNEDRFENQTLAAWSRHAAFWAFKVFYNIDDVFLSEMHFTCAIGQHERGWKQVFPACW